MSDLDPLRNLAQTLAYDPGQPVTMTKGVVQAYSIGGQPPTLDLYLSGDNTTLIQGVRFLDSYSPAIGDVVQVIKQGPMLLVLGQIAGGANHAANGWVEPLLSSGLATLANDPVMYRLILDNGSKKVQLRGGVSITASITTAKTLWTMPADLRPLFDCASTPVAQDDSGGNAIGQITPKNTGVIEFNRYLSRPSVSSTQHGNLTTSYYDINHFHEQDGGGLFTGTTRYSTGGPALDGVLGGSAQDGGRSQNHRHTTNSATHSHTLLTTYPTWVSFNGVEYFI